MTKEDLKRLSDELKNLSEEEKALRRIYLRKLATGEYLGPPTSYPGLDKPWLRYYDEDSLDEVMPHMTIYNYMKENSKRYANLTAVSYYGKKITYSELHENIILASKMLAYLGVQDDDRVMTLLPNIPETLYFFYGASRIGAISDYIDPRPDSIDPTVSSKKVLSLIKDEKSKYIVALDQCYLGMIKPIEKELKELGIEKIIIVSASDSMNLKGMLSYAKQGKIIDGKDKFNAKMKRNKELSKIYEEAKKSSLLEIHEYKDLIKIAGDVREKKVPYRPNKMVAITHTSGTSGRPKPVPITHDNLNAYAHQSFYVEAPFDPGSRVLHILPYFAAYGIANIVHPGLCHGTNLVQIPEIETQNFGKILTLNDANISVGIPSWYIAMTNDPYMEGKDLSGLKFMSFGGIGMSAEDEERVNDFLHEHGAPIEVSKGHGMSETSGCSSLATANINPIRSIGIPLPDTIYSFVDPVTKEPLQFPNDKDEIEGEMIISTKAATSGVLDGKTYIKHANYFGDDYILTGDIARMKRDGTMYFDSRLDRGFPRCDGFNIKPGIIEENIEKNPSVRYCVISSYYDEGRLGNMAKATIVLSEDKDLTEEEKVNLVSEIISEIFINSQSLSARQIPTRFVFMKELPRTSSDKIDYKKIDEYIFDGTEIIVELNESNISLEGIEVKGKKYQRILSKKG